MGSPVFSVVMVSASFHPYVGGAEKQALELSVALKGQGVGVRVATRRLSGAPSFEEVRGVPVVRLWCAGPGLLNALTFMASLAYYLWDQSPFYEAIHVHLAGSPALAAAIVGRILRKRVIVKLGGGKGIGELAASSGTLSGWAKLKALSLLKPQFIAVASELRAEALRYLGNIPVHVVPNGVDTRRYHPVSEVDKARLRRELGWPEGGLIFLYVGRLAYEKRLPLFLETWSDALRRSKTPAFLALVGEGPQEPLIRLTADNERVADRVFMRGPLETIEKVYAAADVFVLPSVSEGLSNALLEAMASGLAVLASRVGGTAEAVEEAVSGFLFKADDREDMKVQISKFLARPALALAMGRSAREAAVARYSLEKVAERYETFYRLERT